MRNVPRGRRLLEIVCGRRTAKQHPHLLAVVTPRQYDPDRSVLISSEGELPLTGRHVLGANSGQPILDHLPGIVVKCPCGISHAINLQPLREIVRAMRAYDGQLPREVSVAMLRDEIATPGI